MLVCVIYIIVVVCRPHHYRELQVHHNRALVYVVPSVVAAVALNFPRLNIVSTLMWLVCNISELWSTYPVVILNDLHSKIEFLAAVYIFFILNLFNFLFWQGHF